MRPVGSPIGHLNRDAKAPFCGKNKKPGMQPLATPEEALRMAKLGMNQLEQIDALNLHARDG